jgi:proteasome lid subunit RPN8/RPN11
MASAMNDCGYKTWRVQWIIVVIKHGEYNEWLWLLNMTSTMHDYRYKTWRIQWIMVVIKHGEYNESW